MIDKAQGIMDFFQIFDEDDLRALPRGLWGIREPDEVHNGTQRPTGEELRSNSEHSLTSSYHFISAPCIISELFGPHEVSNTTTQPLDLIVMPGVFSSLSL